MISAGDLRKGTTFEHEGNVYTVKYGNEPAATYEVPLTEIDAKYVYAGVFTVRSAYVDFSNIKITY